MSTLLKLEQAKRVVIKVGSALLIDPKARSVRQAWLESLALDIMALRTKGTEVILVSSGAIALGRLVLETPVDDTSLATSQAAAAVGQISLAHTYQALMRPHNVATAQLLLTSEDGTSRRRYLNMRATLGRLLELGVLPIINENDTIATDEIRFGDNDRLAAQVAAMSGADTLVLLSDIDGLYTDNPRLNPQAQHVPLIKEITPEILSSANGTGSIGAKGGMKTKLLAAQTAMRSGVNMIIAYGFDLNPLEALSRGARASYFIAPMTPAHARKNWILSMKTRGVLVVDLGAEDALRRGSSLLAVGCMQTQGDFERGDSVDIQNQEGVCVGRGLVAYDSDETRKILRHPRDQVEQILGEAYRGEIVHRDNLALL